MLVCKKVVMVKHLKVKKLIVLQTWSNFSMYQEGAEHVESDEINYGKSTATRHLLPRVVVRLWVTQLPWHTGQHNLLPCLSSGTSGEHTGMTDLINP